MINIMDCAVDAQSLISISLRKIHSSRTQRGGIKLHKNLLVSCVLRNARQVYVSEKYAEIYRMQQYREVMTICSGIQELNPADLYRGDDCEQSADCGGEAASLCGSLQPACPAHIPTSSGCSILQDGCKETEPPYYRSCCMEAYSGSNCDHSPANSSSSSSSSMHCNKTTVLDLDTHVVTTVDNGYLHQDCCQSAQSPAKKRKVDFGYYMSDVEEVPDFVPGCKRAKTEECLYACGEHLDTSHISNLISMFGSGFSGLVSRQAEQFCSKQALASLGAWTRAIVAF